eukprot:6212197-Pleurochrysis_carterae.AAC.1
MLDVVLLRQVDAPFGRVDVHVKQIRYRPFVLDVPVVHEVAGELLVKRPITVVGVEREQVVDVAPKNEALARAIDELLRREDAWVRLTLLEPPFAKPREERTRPSETCLRHAINRFLHPADSRSPVGAVGRVPRWCVAIGSDKIPSPHVHPVRRGKSREYTQRRRPHRSAESLIVVPALHLRTTLHAQACFEGAAALPLVNPNEADNAVAGRHVRAVDHGPAAVGLVVGDFGSLCGGPPFSVVGESLLASLWVGLGARRPGGSGAQLLASRLGSARDRLLSRVGSVLDARVVVPGRLLGHRLSARRQGRREPWTRDAGNVAVAAGRDRRWFASACMNSRKR